MQVAKQAMSTFFGQISLKPALVMAAIIVAGTLSASTAQKDSEKLPSYEILNAEKHDALAKTQLKVEIVVNKSYTEQSLKQLLFKLYQEAKAVRSFKYHDGKATHIFIYAYTSKERAESGMGQWVAMLSKVGKDAVVEIDINKSLLQARNDLPIIKKGRSEAERKAIYKEYILAEDRAVAEAEKLYPLPSPNRSDFSQSKVMDQISMQNNKTRILKEKYTAELIKKHRLTKKELMDIVTEGFKKDWPMPPRN